MKLAYDHFIGGSVDSVKISTSSNNVVFKIEKGIRNLVGYAVSDDEEYEDEDMRDSYSGDD